MNMLVGGGVRLLSESLVSEGDEPVHVLGVSCEFVQLVLWSLDLVEFEGCLLVFGGSVSIGGIGRPHTQDKDRELQKSDIL